MTGRLYGVGTGPGDPELLTLKAVRAIGEADVLAYFAKAGRSGNGRAIVEGLLKSGMVELPLYYPVTVEIDKEHDDYKSQITAFYDASAAAVAEHLAAGRTVAILSEGDPMFYGSYMHLHVRLAGRFPTEVIPGITAMSGCWSLSGLPIVQGDDVLSVLPGTMGEEQLSRLNNKDGKPLFSVSGYGETRPAVADQVTEEDFKRNRRIDIRFTIRRPDSAQYEQVKERLGEAKP